MRLSYVFPSRLPSSAFRLLTSVFCLLFFLAGIIPNSAYFSMKIQQNNAKNEHNWCDSSHPLSSIKTYHYQAQLIEKGTPYGTSPYGAGVPL